MLLGTAFFDLLPEAVQKAHSTSSGQGEKNEINIFLWTLIGILLFFLMERFVHWFHHHEDYHEHEKEKKSTLPLIIVGDTMHNFIDGVVIAATFMADISLGIFTTLAVFAHEIPQEIGDFGLMFHKGLKRKKILFFNFISALAAFVGAILTYVLGGIIEGYIPIFLAVTAGFFIYIAASDLIPEIHHEKRRGFAIIESSLLLLGVLLMWISVALIEHG